MFRNKTNLIPASLVLLVILSSTACFAVDRPFVLWDKDDILDIKTQIDTQEWARATFDKLTSEADHHEEAFAGLLRYAVTRDTDIARKEMDDLLKTTRSPIPRGAAQYINVIRYDLFYDQLTADERKEVETFFRTYIEKLVFKRAIFDPKIFNDS